MSQNCLISSQHFFCNNFLEVINISYFCVPIKLLSYSMSSEPSESSDNPVNNRDNDEASIQEVIHGEGVVVEEGGEEAKVDASGGQNDGGKPEVPKEKIEASDGPPGSEEKEGGSEEKGGELGGVVEDINTGDKGEDAREGAGGDDAKGGGDSGDVEEEGATEGSEPKDGNVGEVQGGDEKVEEVENKESPGEDKQTPDDAEEGSRDEEEDPEAKEDLVSALPTPGAFVSGNKPRSNAHRDTQFYKVLNVSSTWHRNYSISLKEDEKLRRVGEVLEEKLSGVGRVVVVFGDEEGGSGEGIDESCKDFRTEESESIFELRKRIAESEGISPDRLKLMSGGEVLTDARKVGEIKGMKENKGYPGMYFGMVFAVPK